MATQVVSVREEYQSVRYFISRTT